MRLALFLFLTLLPPAYSQEVKDVSVLLPLAESLEMKPALPKTVYRMLPALHDETDQNVIYESYLKVIGIRLDPELRHIRLVWQPVTPKLNTIDAAIHTFYQLKPAEWKSFWKEWMSIPRQTKVVLLKYCGEKNLIRATSISTTLKRIWVFTRMNKSPQGKWTILPNQTYFISTEGLADVSEFSGGFGPIPPGGELWDLFTKDSRKFRAPAKQPELKLITRRAIEMEDPKLHHSENTDCVSCHLAQNVRLWGEKKAQVNRVRMFGYFEKEPIISQRVINESLAALKYLKTK